MCRARDVFAFQQPNSFSDTRAYSSTDIQPDIIADFIAIFTTFSAFKSANVPSFY